MLELFHRIVWGWPELLILAPIFLLVGTIVTGSAIAAFLDLLDKAILAARMFTPITSSEVVRIEKMASEALSVFQREEEQVTYKGDSPWPASPYECPFTYPA